MRAARFAAGSTNDLPRAEPLTEPLEELRRRSATDVGESGMSLGAKIAAAGGIGLAVVAATIAIIQFSQFVAAHLNNHGM